MKLKTILGCSLAYIAFGILPCYAQMTHSITFVNGTTGRHMREISGQDTQDDQTLGISLSTKEDKSVSHSASNSNGLSQEQEYIYVNSAKSQTVEIGHLHRKTYIKHFEVYDYSDNSIHHTVDFGF